MYCNFAIFGLLCLWQCNSQCKIDRILDATFKLDKIHDSKTHTCKGIQHKIALNFD